MPICPLTGLPFEHHELERRHYERFGFPVPEIHPIARRIQKQAYANAWDLYWTTDARTGKKILSCYDPIEHPIVYDHTYWMSTDFDARDYGRQFDFSRSFFEQYVEMVAEIPKPNLVILSSENVDYCNNLYHTKNSYLCFNTLGCENILYGSGVFESRDSMNFYNCGKCELCYVCVKCLNCYGLYWSEFCVDCNDSKFLSSCRDCTNCYQCANLSHKQYCIQNIQYSKEDYDRILGEIDFSSRRETEEEKKKWSTFLQEQPLQAQQNAGCEDSTGVWLRNCKSCIQCSSLTNAENCFWVWGNNQAENSDSSTVDIRYATNTYGAVSSQDIAQCLWIEQSYSVLYSQYVIQSHDCFGCFGVKKIDHGIFNKNYPVIEYEQLKDRIIGHMKETGEWGQYFPVQHAPFPYEKSSAYMTMVVEFDDDPKIVENFGLRRDVSREDAAVYQTISASQIPDSSANVDDSLIGKIFACEETGRPYSIIKQELSFYKKYKLPLPCISWRTAIEKRYPFFYPVPHAARCANCAVLICSYLRPDKTTRRLLCDACFSTLML